MTHTCNVVRDWLSASVILIGQQLLLLREKNRFYDFTYTWLFAVYVKTKPYTWKFSRVRDFPNGTTLRYVPTLREGENHALETPTETISDFETIKISRPNNINVEIQFKKHFMRHNRFGLLISRNSVAT